MELHQGRPADCAGRLEKELRVYDLLEKLEISSVYLVGWSNGGGVSLKLCAQHPEKIKKFFDNLKDFFD